MELIAKYKDWVHVVIFMNGKFNDVLVVEMKEE
jgi:hypothetical protein